MKMVEEPKLDENFYGRRGARIEHRRCKDGLERATYDPYFKGERDCRDCLNFEVASVKDGMPLEPWCRRECTREKGIPISITPGEFKTLPQKCGSWQLLLITDEYKFLVPDDKPAGGSREMPPAEFCKSYPNAR